MHSKPCIMIVLTTSAGIMNEGIVFLKAHWHTNLVLYNLYNKWSFGIVEHNNKAIHR